MAIKVIKSSEVMEINNLRCLLYGTPGSGKTSMASTAQTPLMLDFEAGSKRSAFRSDVIQMDDWQDALDLFTRPEHAELVKAYSTIIIDTIEAALDKLTLHIVKQHPKYWAGDKLALQGFGALANNFRRFYLTLDTLGKDVIFIAHQRELDRGDGSKQYAPKITGQTSALVLSVCDLVGYVNTEGEGLNMVRRLNVGLSQHYVAKNSGNHPPYYEVPNFREQPNWFAGILAQTKAHMSVSRDAMAIIEQTVSDYRMQIASCQSADDINLLLADIKAEREIIVMQLRRDIGAKAKALGLKPNKETGEYEAPPIDKEADFTPDNETGND